MGEKKIKQKTVRVSLRESGAPFDLDKYQRITVPKSREDGDDDSAPDDTEKQDDEDSTSSD